MQESTWASFYREAAQKLQKENEQKQKDIEVENMQLEHTRLTYKHISSTSFYRFAKKFKFHFTDPQYEIDKNEKKVMRSFKKTSVVSDSQMKTPYYYDAYAERKARLVDRYGEWIQYNEKDIFEVLLNSYKVKTDTKKTIGYVSYKDVLSFSKLSIDAYDYLCFAKDPSCFSKEGKELIEAKLASENAPQILYGQEDVLENNKRTKLWAKPEWSPVYFLNAFYFGSYFLVKSALLTDFQAPDTDSYEEIIYALGLHVCKPLASDMPQVERIDYVCYHGPESPVLFGYEEAFVTYKQNYLSSIGLETSVHTSEGGAVYYVAPIMKELPLVSIVIPSKDNPTYLKKCIGSLMECTDYKNLEILVVDNGSNKENQQEIISYLNTLSVPHTYIYEEKTFNFSYMCNQGAEAAKGQYILFLNDDVEAFEKNWLKNMVASMQFPGCGVAGAKLWYGKDRFIQHAGVTIVPEGPIHKMATMQDADIMYYGQNVLGMEKICVTGACLLVRKDLYDLVGGMEESFPIAYNDVDFCLKVIEKGYFCLQCNDAVLYHHESVSRGHDSVNKEKHERLMKERANLFERHPAYAGKDPYYSKLLLGAAFWYEPDYMFPGDTYNEQIMEPVPFAGLQELRQAVNDEIICYVEHADMEFGYRTDSPDSYYISGWSGVRKTNQEKFLRKLIMISEDEKQCYLLNIWDRERLDAAKILTKAANKGLLGFTTHLKVGAVPAGNYSFGILYYDKENHTIGTSFADQTYALT